MYPRAVEKQRIRLRKVSLLKICVLRYSSKFKGTFDIYVSTQMGVVLSSVYLSSYGVMHRKHWF